MKLNLVHFSVAAVAVTWRHKSRHLPSLLLAIPDKTLVVQFTVKHEQKIDCEGGYVKVRRERGRRRRVHVHEEERGRGGEGEYMYMYSIWVREIGGVCTCVKFLS